MILLGLFSATLLFLLVVWGISECNVWRTRALNAEATNRRLWTDTVTMSEARNAALAEADRAIEVLEEEQRLVASWRHAAVKRAEELVELRHHVTEADARADDSFARGWNSAIGVCQMWIEDESPRYGKKLSDSLEDLRTTAEQGRKLEAQAIKGAA